MLQVPILDPGIHVKPGYTPYDSGIKQGVFMRDLTGQPFVGQVRTGLFSSYSCSSSCFEEALLLLEGHETVA